MRKLLAVVLLAIALSFAPSVSAQDAEPHWHPYVLLFMAPNAAALVGDALQPEGYATEEACAERELAMVMAFAAQGIQTASRCSTNDEPTETAEVHKLFAPVAAPGKDI